MRGPSLKTKAPFLVALGILLAACAPLVNATFASAQSVAVAPVVTSINPASGPASGGNQVSIAGTGFGTSPTVLFGGVTAQVQSASNTSITAVAPAGTGAIQVAVVADGQESNGVPYTYLLPVIFSLSPDSGPTAGGNSVVITGTNFGPASGGVVSVTFGGIQAPVTSASDTTITVTAPAGVGSVLVIVTAGGQASNALAYTYDAPVVTSLSPDHGPAAGGNSVVIAGTNFGTSPTVTFAGLQAPVTSASDTSITVTAPAGSGSASVVVTAGGQISNAVAYTYDPAPVLTALYPSHGPAAGGNLVYITGRNLGPSPTVTFGGVAARVVFASGGLLAVRAPSGQGSAAVVVTVEGQASNSLSYTYMGKGMARRGRHKANGRHLGAAHASTHRRPNRG